MNVTEVVGMVGGDYVFVVIFESNNWCELSWLVVGLIGRFIGVEIWCLLMLVGWVVGFAGKFSGDSHEVPVAQARFYLKNLVLVDQIV